MIFRKLLTSLLLFFLSFVLSAGDTPCSATNLTTTDFSFVNFDNSINTDSGVFPPPFGGYVGPDTWISFTMTANLNLIIKEHGMVDPAIAVYQGPCDDLKLLYNILDNNCNQGVSPNVLIEELEIGETYFIRVWAQDGSADGDFYISLSTNLPQLPAFDVFGDAVVEGECIRLTANVGWQQGCAWYQTPIDFTQAFTHDMSANFGTKDASGADGITLVYQTNGPSYCGDSGGGIGAGNMPNSAIFEFDTWQNGGYNDPSQDHCSFNVNGDMNHNNSISGPVQLGNIEDGADHIISFSWDPNGMLYSLSFDGNIELSGSYDIVANCFGGQTEAYWGYTSATGGSSNLQVVCPIVEQFEPATIEYDEKRLCEGDSYNGYTDAGYYVDFIPQSNGCQHQINTLIEIVPLPAPVFLSEVICEDELIEVGGAYFSAPGDFEIHVLTEDGCDSTIFLDLENIILDLSIEEPKVITCLESTIDLIPFFGSNIPVESVTYFWSGPAGNQNTEVISVSNPGIYSLFIVVILDDLICNISQNVEVFIDSNAPQIIDLEDLNVSCDESQDVNILDGDYNGTNIVSIWTFEDEVVSTSDTVIVTSSGYYYYEIIDTTNGCMDFDSAYVLFSTDLPEIELSAPNINCSSTFVEPFFSISIDVDSIKWTLNGDDFSTDSIPLFYESGIYQVTVETNSGCISSESIMIEFDTISPVISLVDTIIGCDQSSVVLLPIYEDGKEIYWTNSTGIDPTNLDSIIFSEAGVFYVEIVDTSNSCTSLDSVEIFAMGNSAALTVVGDILNCYSEFVIIDLQTDLSDLDFAWYDDGVFVGDTEDWITDSAGVFHVVVETENGCVTIDSISITKNIEIPTVSFVYDSMNCVITEASLSSDVENGNSVSWNGPNGFSSSEQSFLTDQAGTYYITVLNPENGCEILDSVEIVDLSILPDFSLFNDTLTCDLTSLNLGFDILSDYVNIEWVGPDLFQSNEVDPLVDVDGIYAIHVELGASCFLDTFVIVFSDKESPEYELIYDSITCNNLEASISTILENQNNIYSLIYPDGTETNNLDIASNQPGQYILNVLGLNGCTVVDTFVVNEYLTLPTVDWLFYDTISCSTPTSTISLSGADDFQLNWSGPESFNSEDTDVTVTVGGEYLVTIENEYGCTSEETFMVHEFTEIPSLELEGDDIDCYQNTADLSYMTDMLLSNIIWEGPGITNSTSETQQVNQEGWYTLQIENEYGCINLDSIYVESHITEPEIILLNGDTIIVNLDNPESQILIDIISVDLYDIIWNNEESLSCSDCDSPWIFNAEQNSFTIRVITEFGCETELTIYIRYKEDLKIFIPNAFTPSNQDGNNDIFTIFSNEHIALVEEMLVYDRWGNLVVKNTNFLPNDLTQGWNGNYKGQQVQKGVYAYYFKVITSDGKENVFIGDVTVF